MKTEELIQRVEKTFFAKSKLCDDVVAALRLLQWHEKARAKILAEVKEEIRRAGQDGFPTHKYRLEKLQAFINVQDIDRKTQESIPRFRDDGVWRL